MLIPILVSAFSVVIGILYLIIYYFSKYGEKSKKAKLTSFDKASEKLFSEYKKIPVNEITVTFTDDKIQLTGNPTIDYSEIEKILVTEDFFVMIWDERITVLQKKDLSSGNVEKFVSFITSKSQNSHNSFEIIAAI